MSRKLSFLILMCLSQMPGFDVAVTGQGPIPVAESV